MELVIRDLIQRKIFNLYREVYIYRIRLYPILLIKHPKDIYICNNQRRNKLLVLTHRDLMGKANVLKR